MESGSKDPGKVNMCFTRANFVVDTDHVSDVNRNAKVSGEFNETEVYEYVLAEVLEQHSVKVCAMFHIFCGTSSHT